MPLEEVKLFMSQRLELLTLRQGSGWQVNGGGAGLTTCLLS